MGDGRRTRFSSHCIRYSLSPPTKGWENITHAHTRARTFITRTTGIDYLLIPVVPNRTRNRKGGSSPTASRLARARLWATYLDAENPSHTQPAPARSAHTRALHGKRGATGHEGNQQLDPGKNRRDERQGGERACGSLSLSCLPRPGQLNARKDMGLLVVCTRTHTIISRLKVRATPTRKRDHRLAPPFPHCFEWGGATRGARCAAHSIHSLLGVCARLTEAFRR